MPSKLPTAASAPPIIAPLATNAARVAPAKIKVRMISPERWVTRSRFRRLADMPLGEEDCPKYVRGAVDGRTAVAGCGRGMAGITQADWSGGRRAAMTARAGSRGGRSRAWPGRPRRGRQQDE